MSYVPPNLCQAGPTAMKGQPPLRDAILGFLTEPQSIEAVAAHLGRSVWATRCHLGEMTLAGLLVAARARKDSRHRVGIATPFAERFHSLSE